MGSSKRTRSAAAPGAPPSAKLLKAQRESRLAPPTIKYNPPWRKVLLRHLKPDQTLAGIYGLLGWTEAIRYWKSRGGGVDLRLSVASQMAQAVGAPLGPFLAELATEIGIPPLITPRKERRKPAPRGKQCTYCKKWSHTRKDCPDLQSQPSVLLMLERGRAHAATGEKLRGRRT